MLSKKFLIVFCSVALVGVSVFGQENTLRLSVKDAENYAIDHNRTMKNASLSVKKAEATKWYAISTMLPQVSGSLDYTNYLGYELNMMGMNIPMNPTSNFAVQASITVSGAQIVSSTLGKLAQEMAQTNYQKTEQTIKSQVRTIYFSILAMESTVGLLNESMENILKLEKFAQQALNVGVSEQTDVDQISVQVSSLSNSINATKRSVEILYNTLRLILGTSVNTEIALTENIDNLLSLENIDKLLAEQLQLKNNLDYQLMEKNVELSKRQVRINEWSYGPSLTTFYKYQAKIEKAEFDMNPPQVFGLTLNIPIFSSGNRLAKVNEAKCDYKSAMNNFEMLSDNLEIQDRQLRYNLRSSYENYETQRKNIDVSQRVFTSISNKYEHGRASSLDITNSSTNLLSAQSNYIQSVLSLLNAQIELETLLNK